MNTKSTIEAYDFMKQMIILLIVDELSLYE